MKNELKKLIAEIDDALKEYFTVKNAPHQVIYDAMSYSLFAGGKRLRPVLMLKMCEMMDGSRADVMPFACAMEMIHTYSLIHDDLPAMDNDDLRRGMPTNHIKFGESTAILAGDALLNKAFEIVSEYKGDYPQRVLRAVNMLASSSGTEGMIGGQIIDIENEGHEIELDLLRQLHLMKTGAIIRSACTIGMLMGGGSEEDIAAADEFAINLGTAFQIRDDILDVVSTEEELGKPIGSDEENDKNTYVKLLGLERSKELVEEYSQKAKAALERFGDKAEFLIRLTDYLINRTN